MSTAMKNKPRQGEQANIEKLTELLRKLVKDQFFGEVGITFQNGRPHTIKVHRTYKVEQL